MHLTVRQNQNALKELQVNGDCKGLFEDNR